MYVLSMCSMSDYGWSNLGVYSSLQLADTAILRYIVGEQIELIDYEQIEFGGEIYYGYDGKTDETVTFKIEQFTVDDMNY